MAIDRYYQTPFTIGKQTLGKVGGRLKRSYVFSPEAYGAFFTPATIKTVRFGKRDFVIEKTLYCDASVDIELGDIVESKGVQYDVISFINTLDKNHHLNIGLVSRQADNE